MLNWVYEVFSANSDKARLVAILISAIVAVSIIVLNQFFLNRRVKIALLIEKIEELYQSAIEYEVKAKDLFSAINKCRVMDENGIPCINQELIDAMNNQVHKIEMLFGLYFPKVNFDKNKYYAGTTLPMLEIAIKEKYISEDESLEVNERCKDKIHANSQEIRDICNGLMNENRHKKI